MELKEMIRQAGIIGCGGAGFPTHAKYIGGPIEKIIINGAECEPLLQTDRWLMRNKAAELIQAADMLLEETKAGECVIALKHSYIREIKALEKAVSEQGSKVRLHQMDSFFPAGDEQSIVYEVTKKVVPPAGLPIHVGCVVNNIATLFCIYEASHGKPFTEKYMTVTGEVRSPVIVKVPVGTPVSRCIELAGGAAVEDYIVINGGPMMGKLMTKEEAEEAFVTKTMSGLILLPADHPIARAASVKQEHMLNRAKSACIQCSFCSQLCPRALLGHPIRPHKVMRKVSARQDVKLLLDDKDIRNAALCCECGICEIYACPMGLQPRKINQMVKKELASAGIRYQREGDYWEAVPEREIRKAPTKRVAARAGVGKYEDIQIDEIREITEEETGHVRLALRQSIGAPSVPVVKEGEQVKKGQVIAACPEDSLGSDLHSPVEGRIHLEPSYIEIRTDKGGF